MISILAKKLLQDITKRGSARVSSLSLVPRSENMAEKIWEEGSDEVLVKAFAKTDKDSLFWGEQTIERKNV
jgi:hypothetical protein